jgi:hypothetical protein
MDVVKLKYFTCYLFTSAVSILDYITSNGVMIVE